MNFYSGRFRQEFQQADAIRARLDELHAERVRLESQYLEAVIQAMLNLGCVAEPPKGNFRNRA